MSAANTRAGAPPLDLSSAETCVIERGEAAASGASLPMLAPAVLRDRYEILSRIGSGGLGVVFAAWDRQLERNVAVKLVRPRARSTEKAGKMRERVLREARSLARLSHPNVVSVFDVGDYGIPGKDAAVFIAMELIEGDTLSSWLSEDRNQDEILEVFDQAGRGLAAAHASDLVHRDFKPDNVMITPEGIVKVLDFGLARVPLAPSEVVSCTTGPELVAPDEYEADRLTRTGVVLGTPRYMAPEQHADAEVGPPADQFAFCVALLGALQDCAVFEGPTFRELALAKHREEIRAPLGRDPTPPWMRRVLCRGLRATPWQRWPSMEHLLDALAGGSKRPWLWAGAGALAALAVGGGALAWNATTTTGCGQDPQPLREVWNDQARTRTAEAMPEASAVFGADAWARLEPRLVQFVGRWESTYADACEARSAGGTEDAVFDAQMACLGRGREALGTVMNVLAEADLQVAARAPNLVAAMPDPRACKRSTLTPGIRMEDGDVALTVRAVEQALAQISTWTVAGRFDAAGFRLDEARARLESHDLPHLQTQLDLAQGRLDVALGRYDSAEEHFSSALARAEAQGLDAFAAEAAIELAECVGIHRANALDALVLADHAEAWVERGGGDVHARARLLGVRGRLLAREARYPEALIVHTQALRLLEESQAQTLARAEALANLSATLAALGRFDEAIERMTEGLGMTQSVHGQAHPATAEAVLRLAAIAYEAEHYDDAARGYRQALAQFEAALGPEHPKVSAALLGWAEIIGIEGRTDEVEPLLERAQKIRVRAYGADDPRVAEVITALALNDLRRGDVESALKGHRTALQMYERTLGGEHDKVGDVMVAISRELFLHGRKQESRDFVDRAHELLVDRMGPEHPSTIRAELLQGYYAINDADYDRAERLFSGALAHARARHHGMHPSIARAHYGLAAGLQERREWDAAQVHLEQVLLILEATGQSGDFNDQARTRIWKGWVHQGKRAEAVEAARTRLDALEAGAWPQDQIPAVRAWVEAHSDTSAAPSP